MDGQKRESKTITIRVKKATEDRAIALYEKTGTTATLASFLGDLVLLGLRVKEITTNKQILKAYDEPHYDTKIIQFPGNA